MKEIKEKDLFIRDLYFASSWKDAVGHNKIYITQDKHVKEKVKEILENEILPQYSEKIINSDEHIKIMENLLEKLKTLGNIRPKPSHAQKLLNMILKYYWCGNLMNGWKTNTPPLCPIDSLVLTKLSLSEEEKSSLKNKNWTEMGFDDYRKVYDFMKKREQWKNPAEEEVYEWNEKVKKEE